MCRTWSQMQEWVETYGDEYATHVYVCYPSPSGIVRTAERMLEFYYEDLNEGKWSDVPEEEREVLRTAVAWKAAARLARDYQALAEGWMDVYMNELRGHYEETR